MAKMGRPLPPLVLADDERQVLEQWVRRAKTSQALALRSKIVMACAEGVPNKEVAARFSVTPQMVGKWRGRVVGRGVGGGVGAARPGPAREGSGREGGGGGGDTAAAAAAGRGQ